MALPWLALLRKTDLFPFMADEGYAHSNRPTLIHVHVCIHCGHPLRREEVDSRQVASGIFHCSNCDLDGPLNVEIREATDESTGQR